MTSPSRDNIFRSIPLSRARDWEAGQTGNQRLEMVFLDHTYRWLKHEGVLLLVIPQKRLAPCARHLAEHFKDIRIRRFLAPECLQYQQVVVFAVRRKRSERLPDAALLDLTHSLEQAAAQREAAALSDTPEAIYAVPSSGPVVLTHAGIPLDEVEDLLPQSAAYRQVRRVLIHEQINARGRPLTPLHGGHVGLLCTAGLLNGVLGQGELLHIACWRSVKFVDHWEEEEADGTKIVHDRERFSHELTLMFAGGKTQILTHEKAKPS